MGQQQLQAGAIADAPPEAVWRLLGDSTTWPAWTSVDAVEILEPSVGEAAGELRRMISGRHRITERIAERVPQRRLTYTVEDGLAVRDYRAVIDLTPQPDGRTAIAWRTTFAAKVPGMGPLYRRPLERLTREFVAGLVAAAGAADTEAAGRAPGA